MREAILHVEGTWTVHDHLIPHHLPIHNSVHIRFTTKSKGVTSKGPDNKWNYTFAYDLVERIALDIERAMRDCSGYERHCE